MKRLVLILLTIALANCEKYSDYLIAALSTANLDLSPKCSQQFGEFIINLSDMDDPWALKMLDATSKLPTGLLSLNLGEMGNFQECIYTETTVNTTFKKIVGKYCLGTISFTKGDQYLSSMQASSFGMLNEVDQSKVQGPTWALCVPDGCTTEDVNTIGNYIFTTIVGQGIMINFSDMLCQTIEDVEPRLTPGAIITICILVLLGLAVFSSTLYDLYSFNKGQEPHLIIKAFSAYSNGKKVFKMTTSNHDQLPCLNGIKFISMMWVVSGHQFSIPITGPLTNAQDVIDWANSLYSMFLISGTLSVDTFLTVGGVLMGYGYMKAKFKNTPFNIFMYYFHRYLRLTPALAMVVLVSSTLLMYMGSGPKWPFIKLYFQDNCADYWWSTLLYVQNYVNVSKMCVGQTWYLCIDMQLYVISPLIFYVLKKYPKICLVFLMLCILSIMGGSFYVSWDNDLSAVLSNFYGNSTDFSNKYYLLTHTRAAPWVIGIILGYYIFKIKQKECRFTPNKITVVVLWMACFAILLTCVLGGHSTLRSKDYDRLGNSFHIAMVRPVWSIAISWVILACTTNYGGPIDWFLSLPIYQVLNRFTYSIYLSHVTLLYVMIYGLKWPDYFNNFHMAYQFWGTLWFSTGFAALLVFMVESPMIILEKIIFGKVKRILKPTIKDEESGLDNPNFRNR